MFRYGIINHMIEYLKTLNENQYKAVTTESQYVRIVAGAGSGKTRVLTFRIAYLVEQFGVRPWNILAITFTNKVAKEMKERTLKLLDVPSNQINISTFHSFCARFLRRQINLIGYPSNYSILDSDDQEKIIKDIGVELGYKRSDKIISNALNYIADKKCAGIYPGDIVIKGFNFPLEKKCLEIYKLYEARKAKLYALDFDDLLLKTIQILEEFPDVRRSTAEENKHILIDEFQDTNDIQFRLLKLIMTGETNLYVVGDPDQTIYTWRGANQDIIMKLNVNFPNVETIVLDVNYRSTKKILGVANKLIAHNSNRIKKNLVTNNGEGCDVITNKSFTTKDEARWVADQIAKLKSTVTDFKYSDVAVLYRSNFISGELETTLTQRRIPNIIYGGQRFYLRAEVKDVLAYFKLINNPDDDLSFLRIINIPRRAIGQVTIDHINEATAIEKVSIYEYFKNIGLYNDNYLTFKTVTAVTTLITLIDEARGKIAEGEEATVAILQDFITAIDYNSYLSTLEDGEDRKDNVKALYNDLNNYLKEDESYSLDSYLQNVSLFSAQDEMKDEPKVKLLTVHTAKGLEFRYVFVVYLNESVFPSRRTVEDKGISGLEEERRLCYVAFTRAKEKLFISCNSGYSFVSESNGIPSRFFKEAELKFSGYDKEYMNPNFGVNNIATVEKSKPTDFFKILKDNNNITWAVGDEVNHKTFGKGIVKEIKSDILIIDFTSQGVKKIIGTHPSLSKI